MSFDALAIKAIKEQCRENREQLLIADLRKLAAELKEDEQEARRLEKQRPENAGYFKGLSVGRMQARIQLENLLEKVGNTRPVVFEWYEENGS
ncbi:hypothetical protein [Photobacterium ganghwense]|uniref:hypothetical protein n=1 Tax=Photobacterium ganghwense TaxID=320778 RepID=UPI0039EE057C